MTGVLGMSSMERIQGIPKVSVIMNCLNCSRYLKEAIDSVYAQTYKDWEIIFGIMPQQITALKLLKDMMRD